MVISVISLIFVWIVAIPIGIYSATHQYSILDYVFTFIGFIGLAVPGFLIALVVLYVVFVNTGVSITGLFSPEYVDAPWSMAKVLDMLPRLVLPVVVIGMSGTAGLIRVMRGMLLDELSKQYVITARAKGVEEGKLLYKYPVRMAINPLISTIGWTLPALISGEAIVSIVLNTPTTGPILLRALMFQDMYLAGSFLLIVSVLTVLGTLLSDILLAWLDPRIRFGGVAD
jgi:peptide/nickel transport system permease protein